MRFLICCMVAAVSPWTADVSHAEVTIDLVSVGNPGNAPDQEVMDRDGTTGYGSVAYPYSIGKYEVTAGQYTEFLNAVADDDVYGLYNSGMWSSARGCKIERSGSSGSYSYTVATDRENRPVNYVSWGDAARFSNWLHNGKPTGAQGLSITEDGAYYLNGATSDAALMAVSREVDWKWAIPTENEWYKAAYHKNDGVTGNYYDYPTSSNSAPSNDLIDPDPGNNANFNQDGYAIGGPYWRTEVGEFENSESPYGTFDQGGNFWEWNETAATGSSRGVRGGSSDGGSFFLHASARDHIRPTPEVGYTGFRVASVPEPGSITLLLCGLVAGLIWWRRRK